MTNNDDTLKGYVVHDAAANLFWSLAEDIGVTETYEAVTGSSGKCLFDQSCANFVLDQYGYSTMPASTKIEFSDAVAAEANHFALKGANMTGIIISDDAETGRSLSALSVDASALKTVPRRVITNKSIEKAGYLCLRHPLPAVVFSSKEPSSIFIEVADTALALGFAYPIYILIDVCQKFSVDKFVMTGIFYIPTPNLEIGEAWGRVIQNSTRVTDALLAKSIETEIIFEW